jgi:hypothetical protein
MSNLSDLLPAGAGAKSADFVASGTLGSGVTVALKADGTVEVVSGVTESVGASGSVASGNMADPVAVYDSVNDKIILNYSGVSNYGTGVVGTISGTTISFGTPVVYNSGNSYYTAAAFDVNAGKTLFLYADYSNFEYGTAIVGTVSGTSISFGSASIFNGAPTVYVSATYDSTAQKTVIAYRNSGSSGNGTAQAVTISGTSVSFGSKYIFNSGTTNSISASYNSAENKTLLSYQDNPNGRYLTGKVATLSGTALSYGSAVVMVARPVEHVGSCQVSGTSKNVVVFRNDGNPDNLSSALVATISGTSISVGAEASTGLYLNNAPVVPVVYDSSTGKFVIFARNADNSYYPTYIVGSISGTTVSFETPVVVQATTAYSNTAVYSTTANKTVFINQSSSFSDPVGRVFTMGATNNTDFIGITDQAIANGASGKVVVQGGVSDKVTSLTANTDYYVQSDGSISATVSSVPAGKALSATSILLKG